MGISAKEIKKMQIEDLRKILSKFNLNEATLEDVDQTLWYIGCLLLQHLDEHEDGNEP